MSTWDRLFEAELDRLTPEELFCIATEYNDDTFDDALGALYNIAPGSIKWDSLEPEVQYWLRGIHAQVESAAARRVDECLFWRGAL